MTEQLQRLSEQVRDFHDRLLSRKGSGFHPTVSSLNLHDGVEIAELLIRVAEELKRLEGMPGEALL